MLLALHMLALGVGTIIFLGMIVLHRRARALNPATLPHSSLPRPGPALAHRPVIWLAIGGSNPKAVQAALGMNCPMSCPWREGISGEHDFFVGPPVNNWVIVTGSGLPHPGRDVDGCFHFLIRLSRLLGHVQFFMADPVSRHHAWARVSNGTVTRAYAWVDGTVWNQGAKSLAEIELTMKCFSYGEDLGMGAGAMAENAAANVGKVPALAARWSFDPTAADEQWQVSAEGVAGKSSRAGQV
jgi:hypothetical protein